MKKSFITSLQFDSFLSDQLSGTPKTPKSQRSVVSSQSTPGSQFTQDANTSSAQLSGIEEMDDDDFDVEAVEQSMKTS